MPQKLSLGLSLGQALQPRAFIVPVLFGGLAGALIQLISLRLRQARLQREWLRTRLREAQRLDQAARMAADVAHDLRNLLTVIQGAADLLDVGVDPEEARRLGATIRAAVDKGTALSGRLLTYSKRQRRHPAPLALNEVLRGLEPLLRGLAGPGVALRTELGPSEAVVHADRDQLELMLLNLATNAVDVMGGSGRLTLALAPAGPGRVALVVRDSGPGIPAGDRERIFEAFYTTKEQGTGLGLASVRSTVQEHGGTVEVSSAPGEGAEFRIVLPRAT